MFDDELQFEDVILEVRSSRRPACLGQAIPQMIEEALQTPVVLLRRDFSELRLGARLLVHASSSASSSTPSTPPATLLL